MASLHVKIIKICWVYFIKYPIYLYLYFSTDLVLQSYTHRKMSFLHGDWCLSSKCFKKLLYVSNAIKIRCIYIYIFILQSVHLLYKYTIQINFCFIRTRRINFSYYTNKLFQPTNKLSCYPVAMYSGGRRQVWNWY